MVNIVVANHSEAINDDLLNQYVFAIQKQVTSDFSPLWHTTAQLWAGRPDGIKGHPWQVALVDTVDEAQALGYHTLTRDGRPTGFVAVEPTVADGQQPSVVLSHEILELLADPLCNRAAQDETTGEFVAYEICDPCQDQGYTIEEGTWAVEVSNFVGPAWFQRGAWGRLDFQGNLTDPFSLSEGGYISVFNPVTDEWEQDFGSRKAREAMEARDQLGPREQLRRRAR